jgi:gluconokinase
MSSSPVILTIDIGSSSVRSRLYGPDLVSRPAGGAVSTYDWRVDGGAMECDAAELVGCVVATVDASVREAADAGHEVVAVGTTSFWHSLLGLGADGDPLTPVIGWGDGRARGSVDRLRHVLDEGEYHRRTGCFLHPSYPAVRLGWLRDRDSAGFGAVRTWASFTDHLEGLFFGNRRTSLSLASGTGLLNLRSGGWDDRVLEAVGVEEAHLPEIVDLDPARGLRPEWARRWPALARVPWYPCLGDGATANLGSGAFGRSVAGLTIGTSAAVRVLRRRAATEEPPPDLWCYHLDAEHCVFGGALSNGGNALDYLRTTFPSLTLEEVDAALREAVPDSHGLTVIPSLVAERGRPWSHEESATLAGVTLGTLPLEIARAWFEAIAQRIAAMLEILESASGQVAEVRASGGAFAVLPGWARTIADATGRKLRLGSEPEASSRGAALVAARELGWIDSLKAAPLPGGALVEPDPVATALHRSARERQHRLARALHRFELAATGALATKLYPVDSH